MGFYEERVLPRIINAACGIKSAEPLRRRVCEGLSGDVVEIGFGSGHNVPFYPSRVERVAAVEPSDLAWRLAANRLNATGAPVHHPRCCGRLARGAAGPQARRDPPLSGAWTGA